MEDYSGSSEEDHEEEDDESIINRIKQLVN